MRGCMHSTSDQIAAKEYAAALRQLDLDERLRKGPVTSSALPECSIDKQVSLESVDGGNSRGKKRACWPASHLDRWRKKRAMSSSLNGQCLC